MEYYICEKQMDEGLQKTAGVKAREDVEVILSQMGCLALAFSNLENMGKES